MEYIPEIISLMYFLAAATYLYWGINIIRINGKGALNRAFLSMGVFLAIWALGYGVANSIVNPDRAFLWIRLAHIGKMFLFSATLHFVILLRSKERATQNRKLLMLIHIPAIIMASVFGISERMAINQYQLIRVNYGWIEQPANNFWTLLFYLYFIAYVVASLLIVDRWKKEFKSEATRRQANLFYITFTGTLFAGIFMDIVSLFLVDNPFPKMTTIIGLVPVWTMYHSAKYYHVLDREKTKKTEIILSDDEQQNIYNGLAAGIIFSGILAFILEFYADKSASGGDLRISLTKAGTLFIIGITLYLTQKIRHKSLKEIASMVILATSIPVVSLSFVEYSTITAWVFPIVLIISSLLFSKRMMLVSTTISAVITQRLIWIVQPSQYVLVDKHDFTTRIAVIIFVYFLGTYINRIYLSKIKENESQIAFQRMTANISFGLVSLSQKNFDEKVDNLLAEIGSFFGVDRSYLLTISHDEEKAFYQNVWCDCDISPKVEDIPLELYMWGQDQFVEHQLIAIEDVNTLPDTAAVAKKLLQERNIQSFLLIPVLVDGETDHFIGIEVTSAPMKWTDEKIKQLNILANTLAGGLIQIEADKEIELMAYYDNLTQLPNRFFFEKKVAEAIEYSQKNDQIISTMFVDLDNFKSVNDTIGHEGGDKLLAQVAARIDRALGEEDLIARFGGDEFLILLNNLTDRSQITQIADKIMHLFSYPFTIHGQEFLITASSGIAKYPDDGESYDELLKNADIAMNEAKTEGKNRYALCTEGMKERVQTNIELSNDLYDALKRDELLVYYQPQIDLKSGLINGVEALVRWEHPTRGMISPGVFIPIAEKNGLINNIGEWVLKTAATQNKKWQDMGLPLITVAVNLSSIQILDQKLRGSVVETIEETGLDPQYIELEITESIAIEKTDYVREVLNNLKKLGVVIAIDDFGTEYSSLSRLSELPVDRLKIDQQFIRGLINGDKNKAITATIISLAKNLGLNVLAEGVETADELAFLKKQDCDEVQGYYYYRPMPASEIEEVLKKQV